MIRSAAKYRSIIQRKLIQFSFSFDERDTCQYRTVQSHYCWAFPRLAKLFDGWLLSRYWIENSGISTDA